MKVAIVTVQIPFVRSAADILAENLAERIAARGHAVQRIGIPFNPAGAILEQMLAFKLLRIDSGDADLSIVLGFPATLCPFPKKRIWLIEMLSFPVGFGSLRGAEKLFAGSEAIAEQLRIEKGMEAVEVLEVPTSEHWDSTLDRLLN